MKIKAAIIDFDGTLTTTDMSDLLARAVGKEKESAALNRLFWEGKLKGVAGLAQRINFLQGLGKDQFRRIIAENDYLRPGAEALFAYFKAHDIITIIASGSTIPFLEIYQEKLGADYLVGSKPKMRNGVIESISEDDYSGPEFKVTDSAAIIAKLGIEKSAVIAIGDSPADKGIFAFAATSIAVNPQSGLEAYADHIVYDDLTRIIPILEFL